MIDMTQKPTRPEAGKADAPARDAHAADAPAREAPNHEAETWATAGRDEPSPAGDGGDERDPFAVLEALNADNAALKDRALRMLADMENLRRRTERDVADARAYGVSGFARDMLTVADNFQRALDTIPADDRASADGAFKALIDGIELTERDLLKTLERHGVRKLEPLGERFDPNMHQAMFEVPDASVPNGTVVQVAQAGFVIGARVLRPALVAVSKGGPKAPPAEQGAAAPAANDDDDGA